jgi:hypothetical protein
MPVWLASPDKSDYRIYTWLVLPAVSRVPGSIALEPHPSSDPGAAFQGNFRLAINSLKAPPGVFIPGFSQSVGASSVSAPEGGTRNLCDKIRIGQRNTFPRRCQLRQNSCRRNCKAGFWTGQALSVSIHHFVVGWQCDLRSVSRVTGGVVDFGLPGLAWIIHDLSGEKRKDALKG